MVVEIRSEGPADIESIAAVIAAAFLNAAHSTHTERFIVSGLRRVRALTSLIAVYAEVWESTWQPEFLQQRWSIPPDSAHPGARFLPPDFFDKLLNGSLFPPGEGRRDEGPVQSTITYVAPFFKPTREEDYRVAWEYFDRQLSERESAVVREGHAGSFSACPVGKNELLKVSPETTQ